MPLIESLKAAGIDAYCPQLPTSDLTMLNVGDVNTPDFNSEPPEGGYPQGDEDSSIILNLLSSLILKEGKRVLIIGHSSGVWVDTEVARPELQVKQRKDRGLSGRIIGLVYIGHLLYPSGIPFTASSNQKLSHSYHRS